MNDKSYLTAIARKTLPAPSRWLKAAGKLDQLPALDYGCGRCSKLNPPEWHNYDPHFWQRMGGYPDNYYNVIVCNYVLCVLKSKRDRMEVLKDIQNLLSPTGIAYISVRNDRPKQGWGRSSKGTYQARVRNLPLDVLHENSDYRIYVLTKNTKLV